MIKVESLSLAHGIQNLSVELPKNRLIGVLGANGAGKSSLLKALAGIIPPVHGRIVVAGKDSRDLSYQARSELIAYLAQETPVHWDLPVAEVIALGAIRRQTPQKMRDNVREVADFCQVSHLLKHSVATLSGGERARVQLARCLMKSAPILLADEPIAALDPYYQIEMMQHLQRLSSQVSCVVALHHLALAYRFCDDIILLKNGKLIGMGATEEMMIAENLATAFQISAKINPVNRQLSDIQQL